MVSTIDGSHRASGVAIGSPGKNTRYIITVCSNIIDRNGSVPKSVNVSFDENMDNTMTAYVSDYSTEKNLALLELPEETERLNGIAYVENKLYSDNRQYNIVGYMETNADNGADQKNTLQAYKTNIYRQDMYNGMEVYSLDAAYNSGAVGGALLNSDGNVAGIVSYSKTDDYSYAVSSDSIAAFVLSTDAEIYLVHEHEVRTYMLIVIIAGGVIFAAAIGFILYMLLYKKEEREEQEHELRAFMKLMGGELASDSDPEGIFDVTKNELLIGRDYNKCNVVFSLNENGISGVHCSVSFDGTSFIVTDKKSSYGTFLENGIKLPPQQPIKLSAGEKIYLANKLHLIAFETEVK
ncbi:MAG: FHA domain-containing protein [Candidatus Ornithomonoglobus sp.]